MVIVGMRPLLPMGSIHLRAGRAVLRIGDPIPTTGLKLHDREALTERMRHAVVELLEDKALVG